MLFSSAGREGQMEKILRDALKPSKHHPAAGPGGASRSSRCPRCSHASRDEEGLRTRFNLIVKWINSRSGTQHLMACKRKPWKAGVREFHNCSRLIGLILKLSSSTSGAAGNEINLLILQSIIPPGLILFPLPAWIPAQEGCNYLGITVECTLLCLLWLCGSGGL